MKIVRYTFEVEVEDEGQCPVGESGGIENWIDDCDGVIDSRLVDYSRIENDE